MDWGETSSVNLEHTVHNIFVNMAVIFCFALTQCPFKIFHILRYKKPVPHTNLKWDFYHVKKVKLKNGMTWNIIFAVAVTLYDICSVRCNMYTGCPYNIQLSSALCLEEMQDINIWLWTHCYFTCIETWHLVYLSIVKCDV